MGTLKIITIIRDDREKNPWNGEFFGTEFKIKVQRLTTGDYTIKGMEDIVAIEKKSGWEEIAADVGKKKNRVNFVKLLRRMKSFPFRALIITDSISKIRGARFYKSHTSSGTILNWIMNVTLEYGIPVFCIGKNQTDCKYFIRTFFKKVHDYNYDGRLCYFKKEKR